MSTKEFAQNEKGIMSQLKLQGIPSQKDLPSGKKSEYSKEKSESSRSPSTKGQNLPTYPNPPLKKEGVQMLIANGKQSTAITS